MLDYEERGHVVIFSVFKFFLFLFLAGVFIPNGNEFAGNCPGVICFLKKDASAKMRVYRSSDGPGEASDILNHKKALLVEQRKEKIHGGIFNGGPLIWA